jgi:hypothetical protein
MARLAMVCEQIKALEQARLANLEQAPGTGPHAMVRLIANLIGGGIETADMLVQEVLSRNLRDDEQWPALPVSPALQMRAVPGGERGGWRSQAMPG